MPDNKNLILALAAILLASAFSGTGVAKTLFDGMTWYHSEDSTGRLFTNDKGHLVWQCRKPDQLVAHLKSPLNISGVGDVAELRILWKSSGQVLGPDCRRKLRHDDCVICLAGTGDFRMGLFDSSGGRRIARDGAGLESDVFKGWRGYQWRFSPHLQTGEPKRWYEPKPDGSRESHTNTRFWKRVTPDDPSPLASRKSWSTMGYEPFDGGFEVPQNEFRLLSFKIKRESDTHITVSISLNGKIFTRTDRDPNNQPEKIDTFAIHMPNARPYHMVVLAPAKRQSGSLESRTAPGGTWLTTLGHPAEDKIDALLDKPKFEMQQLFKGKRFPNVVVAVDGTVLATWGSSSVRARRSEDGGKTWGKEITIARRGFQGGGLTVDEKSGDILAFVEAHHPPAPLTVYRSTDHGKTWQTQKTVIHKDSKGNVPSMHMNEHGITLRYGKHKGRLLRPTRWYAGKNERARWPQHYTNAIYSDDGGKTWHTSDPFPAFGTGEATIAELSDGRIYYNSRRHRASEGANPHRRWTAWSEDGGATWKDLSLCEVLPDGPQDSTYGCMGGLVRLPVHYRDILIYSNCDSPGGRHHGTVWASFDGGKTWPLKRQVYEGSFAYCSLTAGRPRTKSEGWIYIHFEGGPKGGSTMARFNLSWALRGEPTGDGNIPDDLGRYNTL